MKKPRNIAALQTKGRGGFKELDDGNVTRLPHINASVVKGISVKGYPGPANFTQAFYASGRDPLVGSGRAGGGIKLNGVGPATIPPRGVKLGAGFF